MTPYECVRRTIEFQGPDRLVFGGNCIRYAPRGDVVYHFAVMQGHEWWKGGSGTDEWGCVWESNRPTTWGRCDAIR